MQRLAFVRATAACATALATPLRALAQSPTAPERRIAALEHRSGGRLGVVAIDTGDWRHIEYRAFEPFPMCSTFKLPLVAAVLARVDAGTETLDRSVAYSESDLLDYAPVTRAHVREGSMSVGALCIAAIELSDNTAANLLLHALGGRDRFNAFVRSIGDRFTQLDRKEPELNSALPGDTRDCTTPHAMAKDIAALFLGTPLSAGSRSLLESWMVAAQTGRTSLRAGIPATWRAGDKTGTGERGTHNDVAILRPPHRSPIIVTSYLTGATAITGEERNAALAEVGQIVSTALVPA